MDSIDYAIPINNGYTKAVKSDNISKLHSLVNDIEVSNSITVKVENNFNDEKVSFIEDCSLDEIEPLENIEYDTDMNSEDSWLYQSPTKISTPQRSKNTEIWLKENVSTPELLRIRGSLSARLEVIGIESRKEQYNSARRKDSYENRKISKTNKMKDFGSSMSLDWDFDVRKPKHLEQTHYAWVDRLQQNNQVNERKENKPFKLNWSDEEELEPMKMNFNSPTYEEQRYKSGVNYQRSGSGLSSDGLGVVRPRGMQPRDSGVQQSSNESTGFRSNAIKRSISFAEEDIILEDLDFSDYRNILIKTHNDAGRGSRISKPVPRRNPEIASESNLVKPRGSMTQLKLSSSPSTMHKSVSESCVNDSAVRRRGTPASTETLVAPRKSLEPPQVSRLQGLSNVRKSTGSIPKRDENVAKPRRSVSPSPIARPRGQVITRSYQADF
ncbi:SLAIN motif-containing protein 2 isoform X11 [Hydra vulgaris]|uniref:SLAIN motif-containing protein 2 isoform X11 n=1 Tax=Hydra vulgaris TaxID=6087 RepID=A0ABM4D450_HYDVU